MWKMMSPSLTEGTVALPEQAQMRKINESKRLRIVVGYLKTVIRAVTLRVLLLWRCLGLGDQFRPRKTAPSPGRQFQCAAQQPDRERAGVRAKPEKAAKPPKLGRSKR